MKGNSYFSRKLHSLVGLIPLGAFFVVHALANFQAFERGPEGFQKAVGFINGMPLVFLLEIILIYIPLLFHGIYGLYVAYQSNSNLGRFKYGRNWAFTAQRITGVITFVFVFWHVYQTRIQVYLGFITHEELGTTMHLISTNNFYFIAYLIGVVAASFHFANGVWAFLISWGITVGERAQKLSSRVCMGIFIVIALLFILSLVAFRGDEFSEAAQLLNTVRSLV